jgi:hypothetical protein
MVELSQGSHLKRGFSSSHVESYHDLKANCAKLKITKEYTGNIFTGAAIQLGSDTDLVKLAQASGVQVCVWQLFINPLLTPINLP